MATKKGTTDAKRAAALSADTWASFARVIGETDGGKRVRRIVRTRLGAYKSKGTFTEADKATMYAFLVDGTPLPTHDAPK